MLLQLGLTAGIAGPIYAGDFILPLDATENLPKGQLLYRHILYMQSAWVLCHQANLYHHVSALKFLLVLAPGYEELTRRLVTALQDSISADINGASENEVKM